MRLILCIFVSLIFFSAKAQTYLPASSMNYVQWPLYPNHSLLSDGIHSNQKWHLGTYAGISTGFGYVNGRSSSYVSAPIGLQLTRQLNNNLYAFVGASAGPAFFGFNPYSANPALNKSYPGYNAYGFGMHSKVEMGLMYVNDAKTFSISGSIGIEQGSYPVYPANKINTRKQ